MIGFGYDYIIKTKPRQEVCGERKDIFMAFDLQELLNHPEGVKCACGKVHKAGFSRVIIESGAINRVPEVVRSYGAKKVFLLADHFTYAAAGERVAGVLEAAGIPFTVYCLPGEERIEPDEHAVGSVAMHFDYACDLILGVGSGVVNDIGKIIANLTNRQYVIFGTAPSMDGYASATSSTIRDSLKVSLDSRVPDTVIGDLDILAQAPMRMILSGLGDMLAKYISIAEWRISHIINGEYYCERVAELVNEGLAACMDNLAGIAKRDKSAIAAVMNGMVLSGIAANYAGVSRPASGMEHYLSHICDMRGVEFGLPFDLHGIQCGAATVICLGIYKQLRDVKPDREKALAYVERFSYPAWAEKLHAWLGKSGDVMAANEARERKYDKELHRARLERIIAHWDEIEAVIHSLPLPEEIVPRLQAIGLPVSFAELGFSAEETRNAILFSKDVRDKYIGSRLMWDLGILDEIVK